MTRYDASAGCWSAALGSLQFKLMPVLDLLGQTCSLPFLSFFQIVLCGSSPEFVSRGSFFLWVCCSRASFSSSGCLCPVALPSVKMLGLPWRLVLCAWRCVVSRQPLLTGSLLGCLQKLVEAFLLAIADEGLCDVPVG